MNMSKKRFFFFVASLNIWNELTNEVKKKINSSSFHICVLMYRMNHNKWRIHGILYWYLLIMRAREEYSLYEFLFILSFFFHSCVTNRFCLLLFTCFGYCFAIQKMKRMKFFSAFLSTLCAWISELTIRSHIYITLLNQVDASYFNRLQQQKEDIMSRKSSGKLDEE